MKLDFSVGLGRNERIDEIADHSRTAEESGFSHLTFVDQPNISRDVHVMMTIAAVNTHHIFIGQGVTDPITFHPSVIANVTATVDELSGGRAFLGLGGGGPWGKVMNPRPLRELRDTVQFLRQYMSGEDAEYKGARMHSEWIRRPVPIYLAADGPKALQLAGEMADGVIFTGIHPVFVKWRLEQIEKGALKVGRDPSKIDTWVRTMIYVADSKEEARREVSVYPSAYSYVHSFLQREDPDIEELRMRLERAQPGLVEGIIRDSEQVSRAWEPYWHERLGAPHSKLVTQRLIDFYHPTGRSEGICEQILKLGQLGAKTISTVTYTIIDKKGMMREIGDKILPHFRN